MIALLQQLQSYKGSSQLSEGPVGSFPEAKEALEHLPRIKVQPHSDEKCPGACRALTRAHRNHFSVQPPS